MGIFYVRLPAHISLDRERVSRVWAVVLHDMREQVAFDVNEGHRTFARQAELVATYGLWTPSNRTGAAAPSHNAPHIRTGRFDHAIDFDNADAVVGWLAQHGLQPFRPIMPDEPWHVECPAAALAAYYARHKARSALRFLGDRQRKASSTLLRRRRMRKAEAKTGRGPRWRRLNRAVKRSEAAVGRLWRRARKPRIRRVLRRVLKDRNGRL